jgi:hypothetical protein
MQSEGIRLQETVNMPAAGHRPTVPSTVIKEVLGLRVSPDYFQGMLRVRATGLN